MPKKTVPEWFLANAKRHRRKLERDLNRSQHMYTVYIYIFIYVCLYIYIYEEIFQQLDILSQLDDMKAMCGHCKVKMKGDPHSTSKLQRQSLSCCLSMF